MIMDCREVKRLLPLWIGQDLPDAVSASDVALHLEHCRECDQRRVGLQTSLEALQNVSAETLTVEPSRHSLWPKLATQIYDWDNRRHRERFNGWIPASVMAMAVALMVAVSIPSIHEEFFGSQSTSASAPDLFVVDLQLQLDSGLKSDRPLNGLRRQQQSARGTPVVYRPEQW